MTHSDVDKCHSYSEHWGERLSLIHNTSVYLTVHASCFSSCQNATPLVRFETLSLMQLALKRATAVVEHCWAQERSAEGMWVCRIAPGCCPDTHVF